jgi:enterochelin esterase-like enzyme
MLPWHADLTGRIERHTIDSQLLRDNPLGDPHERPIWVYLPPGYDDTPDRHYPSVYVIQGYSANVTSWANRMPYRRTYPELVDAVFTTGDVPPAVVIFVDAWTAYGGSQFLDSPGTGRYHSYLCDEVVLWVDNRYRVIPDRDHRAITGKSSGGYGAMITPMLRPDLFGALATHAGDALFDTSYRAELPSVARLLRDQHDGSYEQFFTDLRGRIFGTSPSVLDKLILRLDGSGEVSSDLGLLPAWGSDSPVRGV